MGDRARAQAPIIMSDLPSSRLGTKEHWDSVYEREVKTFKDIGDEGEVWFGEESAESMVDWAIDEFGVSVDADKPTILDVGCGNAHLLLLFLEAGYKASIMTGIDYSPASIELSKAICRSHEVEGIQFECVDLIGQDDSWTKGRKWDFITDKGTYDAIALAPQPEDSTTPHPLSLYPQKVAQLLSDEGGIFLITSCNFTEQELKEKFISPATGLAYYGNVPKETFTFGGQTGSTVSTVAFVKGRTTA